MKSQAGQIVAFRVVHEDNLPIYLKRGALHAANHTPPDGLVWRPTHNAVVQSRRASKVVPKGPGGVMLDYVPFHFGARNIFLYNLHTNYVQGLNYTEGQGPLVTLAISVDSVIQSGTRFVFYDGHALDALSTCHDDPAALATLNWKAIDGTTWPNSDPDRKRCKQAEFMVHKRLPWSEVRAIGVCDDAARKRVKAIQAGFPKALHKRVVVMPSWYF